MIGTAIVFFILGVLTSAFILTIKFSTYDDTVTTIIKRQAFLDFAVRLKSRAYERVQVWEVPTIFEDDIHEVLKEMGVDIEC